jgi:hypothetical protein
MLQMALQPVWEGLVDRQWTEARKVAAADRAYVNDGDPARLRAWVTEVFAEFATPAHQ